jgi:hypothetical protein
MNGNGQVVIAGLVLVMSIVAATLAVGTFEVPTYEPEAKPVQLLDLEADAALLNPAPIELILRYTGSVEQGLKPEQIYHGVMGQTLAKTAGVSKIQAHSRVCSGLY